jgi:HEAT repeat protein
MDDTRDLILAANRNKLLEWMVAVFLSFTGKRKEKNTGIGGMCMPEGLSWLQNYNDAYCLTFARGLDETEMLRRFGTDLSLARLIREDDRKRLDELRWFGEVVQAGQSDGWAFVYEGNGYTGTLEDILRSVSAGTVAVSVFRNVNGVTRFCYAEGGVILAHFEPFDPPFDDPSPQLQELLHRAGLTPERYEQEDYNAVEIMFALAQAAGIHLEQENLDGKPLLSSFLRNPVSDFLDELFTQGGNEQTTNRFLALLEHHDHRGGLFRLLEHWQKPECSETVAKRIDRALEALHSVQIIEALLEILKKEQSENPSKWGAAETRRWQNYDGSREMAVTEVVKALIRFDLVYDQPGARERLLTLTTAPNPEVVRHAALALGKLKDQRAVEPLIRVLTLYPREREAIRLLGQMQNKSAAEPLLRLLNPQDNSIDFQREVLKALVQIGEVSIAEQLIPLLHAEPQWALLEVLEQMPRPQAIVKPTHMLSPREAFLRQLMHDCSFQKDLLASLGQLSNSSIVEPLLNLLIPHPRFGYRGDFYISLLEALGMLGEPRAIEPLASLLSPDLRFSEWRFQQALVRTLRQLGDTRAELQTVEEALQHFAEDYHRQTGKWLDGKRSSS